jgi:predicted ATP-grasp superfamily ATP-dependent carboligase
VGGDREDNLVVFSRYCRERLRYPDPTADAEGFVAALLGHVRAGSYDVLLPLSDETTIPIVRHRDEFLPHVRMAVPPYEALRRAYDKSLLLEMASDLGIAVPRTFRPQSMADMEEIAHVVEYPCVFKLRRGAGAVGLVFPRTKDDLLRCYRNLDGTASLVYDRAEPLVQEFIPGEVHDACLLFRHGEPRAVLTQRRIRMYPPAGGIGIYNETTDHPVVRKQAITLLQRLVWHGPAMVEFRVDARDNIPKLMEVNGRYWGTLDLAIQAGIDFPYLACCIAVDGDVDPVHTYQAGMKYRWPIPYGWLFAKQQTRRWSAFWEFLRRDPHARSDLWLTDPWPHIMGLVHDQRRRRALGLLQRNCQPRG